MHEPTSRRHAIRALLGVASLGLIGCARPGRTTQRPVPGPVWPRLPREDVPPVLQRRFVARPGALVAPRGVKSRTAWTSATTITQRANRMIAIKAITVHHDGMQPVSLSTEAGVRDRLDNIRRGHLGHGWADIGYHFIVDPSGEVWEGRPLRFQGAHVRNNNERNLGILVLGHFDRQSPTLRATAALDEFIVEMMSAHRVPLSRVRTHGEIVATACPGRNLQRHMDSSRSTRGVIGAASRSQISAS